MFYIVNMFKQVQGLEVLIWTGRGEPRGRVVLKWTSSDRPMVGHILPTMGRPTDTTENITLPRLRSRVVINEPLCFFFTAGLKTFGSVFFTTADAITLYQFMLVEPETFYLLYRTSLVEQTQPTFLIGTWNALSWTFSRGVYSKIYGKCPIVAKEWSYVKGVAHLHSIKGKVDRKFHQHYLLRSNRLILILVFYFPSR